MHKLRIEGLLGVEAHLEAVHEAQQESARHGDYADRNLVANAQLVFYENENQRSQVKGQK